MRNDRVSTIVDKKCELCGGVYQLFEYNIGNTYTIKRYVCLLCKKEMEIKVNGCSRENKHKK